jgi:hypothetical protein
VGLSTAHWGLSAANSRLSPALNARTLERRALRLANHRLTGGAPRRCAGGGRRTLAKRARCAHENTRFSANRTWCRDAARCMPAPRARIPRHRSLPLPAPRRTPAKRALAPADRTPYPAKPRLYRAKRRLHRAKRRLFRLKRRLHRVKRRLFRVKRRLHRVKRRLYRAKPRLSPEEWGKRLRALM